jgi:integrase
MCGRIDLTHVNRTQVRQAASADESLAERCPLPGSYCAIVKLLILTGQRRGEIAALQSSWINEKEKTLSIPASVAKNGRQHVIPLTALSVALLVSPKTTPSPANGFMFSATDTSSMFSAWSKNKIALDEATGVKNWTLHDIRRTVASNMGALGVRLEVIERILNHVSGSFGGVAGTYQRYEFLPEMMDASHTWEGRLRTIISGSCTQT